MKCRKCGCELNGSEKFCPSCGTRVESAHTENIEDGTGNSADSISDLETYARNMQNNVDDVSHEIDSTKGSKISFEKTKKHYEAWERTSEAEIIQKKTEYYQKQFDEIRSGKKGKINWASFFLGLFHAGYRNVWKEWLKGPGMPQIVTIAVLIRGGIEASISGEIGHMALIASVLGTTQLVGCVLHIRFALHFNRIYKKHVADKMSKKDHRPDPSVLRAILVSMIFYIVFSISQGMFDAGSIGATFSTVSEDMETDLLDILQL